VCVLDDPREEFQFRSFSTRGSSEGARGGAPATLPFTPDAMRFPPTEFLSIKRLSFAAGSTFIRCLDHRTAASSHGA
jgi:hypothetical protein